MAGSKNAALLAIVGGKYMVSYYDTEEEAQNAGADYGDDLEGGWAVTSVKDLTEITIPQLQGFYDLLSPKAGKVGTKLADAKAAIMELLSKHLKAPEAAVVEPGDDEVEPEPEEDSADNGDVDQTQEEASVAATTKTTAKKAKAPVRRVAPPAAAKAPAAKAPMQKAAAAKTAKAPAAPAPKAKAAKAKAPAANTASPSEIAPAQSVSDAWKKIFKVIAKAGEEGMSVGEMKIECEKQGVGLYYRRFVAGGYLKRVARGYFVLTPKGTNIIADAKK